MKKFLKSIITFFLLVCVILIIIILSPTTYSASQSLIFSSIKKDSLLQYTPQPRVILSGGSSLAYGFSSHLIKDSLNLNVINNGIHAGLGLKYMLEKTEPYLKAGDIYIIAPEYEQYYEGATNGSEQLLRTVLDVSLSNAQYLGWNQIKQISQFLPQYLKSKLQLKSYRKTSITAAYRYTAFNEYGDASYHWDKPKIDYPDFNPNPASRFNEETLNYLLSFIKKLEDKGITVYVSFPGIQDIAAANSNFRIEKVYSELTKHNVKMLGKPEDYIIPDSLTFDTYYHLSEGGAAKRTNTLIHFLKESMPESNK